MNEQIKHATLTQALTKMFGINIINATYQTEQLQGGTLGDVLLVTGMAKTYDGGKLRYKVVLKMQIKWERPGDPDSWRREYDLYISDFGKVFSDSFRWPKCYFADISDDKFEIWMEYIDGVSGNDLTIKNLEYAATELGRFQGKLYMQPELIKNITCFSDTGFIEREHMQWHTQTLSYEFLISEQCRLPKFIKQMLKDNKIQLYSSKSLEYSYLRSEECDIPNHLKQILIDIDDHKETVFQNIKRLPVVLCHRDFWIENIFLSDGRIRLIDWDGVGWGFMCEDIASLIFDDTDVEYIDEYCRKLVPAYCKGISEYMDVSVIKNLYIHEMIIIKFGYRILQNYMFTQSSEIKKQQITALQKVYELLELDK